MLKEKSRTRNVIRNVSASLITQGINLIISFVCRTIFIKMLSVDYLGINGLFSNILVLLSFAELGIGETIIYSLYKPLAENDKKKINSLMRVYSITYRTIGIIVIVVGLVFIPLLDILIVDVPNIIEDIRFLYVLFLLNTACSYFFSYRKSIILADQKKYVVSIYQQVCHTIQVILQMFFLILTKNYVVYLCLQLLFTIINNIAISIKSKKMYPYINVKNAETINIDEKRELSTNVKSLFLYKLGDVILSGSDNIIISSLVGVVSVGLVSNYQMVVTAFTTIFRQILGSFTASVGNMNVLEKAEKKIQVFEKMLYISVWIAGIFTTGMILLMNPLIKLWLGEEYLLSPWVVVSIVIYFFLKNIQITALTFRTTMGYFREGRFAPLLAAVINVLFSVFLGKVMGLLGIFMASSIAILLTIGIVDPILVYGKGFQISPFRYYKKYFYYLFVVFFAVFICKIVLMPIKNYTVGCFIFSVGIITVIYNIVFVSLTCKMTEFETLMKLIKNILNRHN